MARVKNPMSKRVTQVSGSIVVTTVGECLISLHSNAVVIWIR